MVYTVCCKPVQSLFSVRQDDVAHFYTRTSLKELNERDRFGKCGQKYSTHDMAFRCSSNPTLPCRVGTCRSRSLPRTHSSEIGTDHVTSWLSARCECLYDREAPFPHVRVESLHMGQGAPFFGPCSPEDTNHTGTLLFRGQPTHGCM